jgi:hypothetical protein
MESMETASQSHASVGTKIRTLVIGALTMTALSIPAVTAVGVSAHDAARFRPEPIRISPDSHRLAITLKPASLRLT